MDHSSAVAANSCRHEQTSPVDRVIGTFAGSRGGVISHEELVRLGAPGHSIGCRLRVGRLHRLQRGVYAVGRRLVSQEGVWRLRFSRAGP